MRRLAIWAAVVVPIWIVMVLCTHWEPVQRDGWGHLIWQRHTGLTWSNLIDFARGTYVHNNPRLGQVATLLMFTPGPWHALVTPLPTTDALDALTIPATCPTMCCGSCPRTAAS